MQETSDPEGSQRRICKILTFRMFVLALVSSATQPQLTAGLTYSVSSINVCCDLSAMEQSLSGGQSHISVLSCFPPSVGRDVAVAVVKPLADSLRNHGNHSLLCTDRQVKWTMEVLCYGLTLQLDGDTVKLCVDVYTDWLMALVSQRVSLPPPISREPNLYVQKILRHLYSLFLPRSDQVSAVNPSLCRQVLCAVRSLARESVVMSRDTWEALLHFLLRVNHAMLAPPTGGGGVSDLSIAILLEVWLLSCSRCFPSRLLWQMCRQMLSSWRHQPVVVKQWTRIVAALTSRLLLLTFGPSFPKFKVPPEDAALIPANMDDDSIPQIWFRFLHMFSNPVDLSRMVTSSFSQEEVLRGGGSQLPNIFFRAMREVGTMVDAFLGVIVDKKDTTGLLLPNTGVHVRDRLPSLGVAVTRSPFRDRFPPHGISRPRSGSAPPTPMTLLSVPSVPPSTTSPPLHVRQVKAAQFSKIPSFSHHWKSSSHHPALLSHLCSASLPPPSPLRCKVDSILHLFGCWLFDAAQMNRDSGLSESWAVGQAEACKTLCRIFTCKRTAEDILPVYLSRFYLILLQGLQLHEPTSPVVLASILLNSTALFCCDLRGVNILLPSYTTALESVLLDRELLKLKNFVGLVDLRRASTLILLSLLPLPLQLESDQSQVLLSRHVSGNDVTAGSFVSLKRRLINLLIGSLQTESDALNTQLILAGMLNLIHDLTLVPVAGQTLQETVSQCGGTSRSRGNTSTRGNTAKSDAAADLWVQFVHLLIQYLTTQWRKETAVCLSALDALGGLAKVEVKVEEVERRRVISSVCSYIMFQCSRPPPLHSRDLHSIIVAAFYCLSVWITQHPAILDHKECLLEVLEIVELGISGTKSRQDDEVKCKEKKELSPASLRVKEAAEVTLNCVMQVSGATPFVQGFVNEDTLIGCSSLSNNSVKKFRYFVVDNSVILATLEQPPRPEKVSCPSLTVLIRGPLGCHGWTLQLRLEPREGRTHPQQTLIPGCSGVAQVNSGKQCGVTHQPFTGNTDGVPIVKADLSIPALNETVNHKVNQELEHFRTVLKRQQLLEEQWQMVGHFIVGMTCRPLAPVTNFQTSRFFLSNMGLLTPETVKDLGTCGIPSQLLCLDSSCPGFSEDLRRLDLLPSKNCDSAFVFYMKAGQTRVAEIIRNVESRCSVSSYFLDFLSSLGQPVHLEPQLGSRTNCKTPEFSVVLGDSGGGVFNGDKFVLKFTDALTELTFIVPTSSSHMVNWLKNLEEAELPSESSSPLQRHSELSKDAEPTGPPAEDTNFAGLVSSFVGFESNLLIVWVELFDDIESFPLSDLLSETKMETSTCGSSAQLIFIHPLKTGLYRIRFHATTTSKFSVVTPLVNGSVVSKRSLGFLVREMVINCCQRRRLESDSAPPPHIRRKHVINDIIRRYRSRRSEPAFYSSLFHDL